MPLKLAPPPPGALGVVGAALDRLQHRTAAALRESAAPVGPAPLVRTGRGRMTSSVPHPVYHLGLEELVRGGGLDQATLVGWRYLLEAGGRRVLGFAETSPDVGGGVEFRALNTGGFGQATRDAVEAAEQLTFVERDEFEIRLLRVPALSLTALWLASPTAEDALIPLPPAPRGVTVGAPVRAPDLLALLRPLAVKRAAFRE